MLIQERNKGEANVMMNRFSSKTTTTKKGGKNMKTLICGLCLLVIAGSAFAATATLDVYKDFNLIAVPNVPLDSSPTSVFSTTGDMLEGYLNGFDAVTQSAVGYSQYEPLLFGGMLLGEGYQMFGDADATYHYEGLDSGVPTGGVKTDMWISLPGWDSDYNGTPDAGGLALFGNPYAEALTPSNAGVIKFTDGTDVKTWQEAYDAGWVNDSFEGMTGATQSATTIDVNGYYDTTMPPGNGFWLWTFVPNIAMIITAP